MLNISHVLEEFKLDYELSEAVMDKINGGIKSEESAEELVDNNSELVNSCLLEGLEIK